MPELPEVETIKRGLERYLIGHSIRDIQILDPLRFTGSPEEIMHTPVARVRRKGKGLVFDFENGNSMAVHVKMTGQLIYRGEKTKNMILSPKVKTLPNKHTRVIFHLDNHAHLYYNDIRRFGWIKVLKTSALETIPFFKSLGPEPFETLTLDYFINLLNKNKSPVKAVIMDQTKIAGVGNIYANDALYEAKVDPRRPANSLSKTEAERVFNALHEVMRFSIEHGAASDTNYVDALGQDGQYQNYFKIYGRKGEDCVKCGSNILRVVIGGRSTFVCEGCQK